MAEPEQFPDLRDVFDSLEWHRRAARRGEEDRLFLPDRSLGLRKTVGSATVTLALSICAGCPVRHECLVEGLRDVRIDLDPRSDAATHPNATVANDGIWGGSLTVDRIRVRHLSRDEAAAVLEESFPARLALTSRRSGSGFRSGPVRGSGGSWRCWQRAV